VAKKPSEKGGKFMEIFKAKINRTDQCTKLVLSVRKSDLEIALTEDKPNDVKNVFNELLIALKSGEFNFKLEDDKEDLFFHISKEYINQLNSELSSVFNELKDYDLIKKK
jgi:hypothetical protein